MRPFSFANGYQDFLYRHDDREKCRYCDKYNATGSEADPAVNNRWNQETAYVVHKSWIKYLLPVERVDDSGQIANRLFLWIEQSAGRFSDSYRC